MAFISISDVLDVVLEENDDFIEEQTRCLVIGRIISDRKMNRNSVISQLRQIWTVIEAPIIKEIKENTYGISFRNERIRDTAIAESPHLVNRCCMELHRWPREKSFQELDTDKISFWIQLHNVPLNLASLKNVQAIGSKLGSLIEAEDPFADGVGRGFLRVRIQLDARNPLKASVWLPRSSGEKIEIYLKYEKLQAFCFCCGRLGHVLKSCGDGEAHTRISYSSELRANAIMFPLVRRDDFWSQTKEPVSSEACRSGKMIQQQARRAVEKDIDPCYVDRGKELELQMLSKMRKEMDRCDALIMQREKERAQLRGSRSEDIHPIQVTSIPSVVCSPYELTAAKNVEESIVAESLLSSDVVKSVGSSDCSYRVNFPEEYYDPGIVVVGPVVDVNTLLCLTADFVRMNLKRKLSRDEVSEGYGFEECLGRYLKRGRLSNGEGSYEEKTSSWLEGRELVVNLERQDRLGEYLSDGYVSGFHIGALSSKYDGVKCKMKHLKGRKGSVVDCANFVGDVMLEGFGGCPTTTPRSQ